MGQYIALFINTSSFVLFLSPPSYYEGAFERKNPMHHPSFSPQFSSFSQSLFSTPTPTKPPNGSMYRISFRMSRKENVGTVKAVAVMLQEHKSSGQTGPARSLHLQLDHFIGSLNRNAPERSTWRQAHAPPYSTPSSEGAVLAENSHFSSRSTSRLIDALVPECSSKMAIVYYIHESLFTIKPLET